MDLSEVAAYHSKIHSHREIPEDSDSRETLETVFLCMIPRHLGAAPNEYQFLESTIIERSTRKVARIEISSVPMEDTATLESCYDEKQAMNFTITADETILMPSDTSNAESKPAGQYDIETICVDAIQTDADEFAHLTRRVY